MLIVTDSAADLSPQEVAEWGVQVVPLLIQFPDGEVSSADISADAFYDRLRAIVPDMPSTSQPSPEKFMAIYKQARDNGEEVLSIHISSGLSGTHNAALLAARQVEDAKVTVWDSQTLSPGLRFQVWAAVMAARAGWSSEQIVERLTAIRAATEAVFTLDTLDYLARGGRIGRVQALAGSILHIKPVIKVDKHDGKYGTIGRGRTIDQSIKSIANFCASTFGSQPVWATVIHGQFEEKAATLTAALQSQLNIGKLDSLRISPVLGVHTGPGVVGVGIVPLDLVQDL